MLSRLTLTVSQACNLRCAYCYADGGGYGMPSRMMSPQVAAASVARTAAEHPLIENIQFFGGEPLTNLAAMEAAADAALSLADAGRLSQPPKFSIVTNLTLLDDRALAFLVKRRVHTIVSLDGPAEIHDALRPNTKGRGTHATIIASLKKMQAAGLMYDLVTTYTPRHWLAGHTVYGLLAYLNGFDPNRVDVVNAAVRDHPELDPTLSPHWADILVSHTLAIERILDGLALGRLIPYGLVLDLMRTLQSEDRPRSDALCPAGRTNLAIAADGTAYPCHMLIGTSITCAQPALSGAKPSDAKTQAGCPGKSTLAACRVCWAAPWCTMCIGKLYIHQDTNSQRPEPVERLCEFSKATLTTLFAQLPTVAARMRDNPAQVTGDT